MNDDPQGPAAGAPSCPQPLKRQGGRPPLLHPTPETLQRVYDYALRTPNMTDAAAAFGVCNDTFASFLKREETARARWAEGQAERARIRRHQAELALAARAVDAAPPPVPGPGETCPTCGQPVLGPEAVTLTHAEIENAARQFDHLIDRYLAAKKAPRGPRRQEPARQGRSLP